MVSKRQRLARRNFTESHPSSNPAPTSHKQDKNEQDSESNKKKKTKRKRERGGDDGKASNKARVLKTKTTNLRKHPLRVAGMKPGEGCFICHSKDHIAKLCPKKSQFDNKKICLLCRERGHTLKYCPNGQQGEEAVCCYNCGETGHRLSKCPEPIKNGGTTFAECFLCKERGHLSKNCPTNTHGIYPKGGSCKICGGLTHLAKDCPEKHNQNPANGQGRTKLKISKEAAVAAKPGEQGQRIVFRSGDDLEDDFIADGGNIKVNGEDHSFENSQVGELSTKVERGPLKSREVQKKKVTNSNRQTTKIVNFM